MTEHELGLVLNILGVGSAIVLSVVGAILGWKANKKAEKAESYSTVDSILKDVLSAGLDNPKFRNQEEIDKFWEKEETINFGEKRRWV